MEDYIYSLIEEGEHYRQDFKFAINDARKIAKSVSAFANTSGGRLLIGVKDNGKIAGVRSDEEYYMIESAVQVYTRPEPAFSAKTWNVEGKTILEISIKKGNNRPYYAQDENKKWLAYTRIEDENYLINNVILRVWKHKKADKGAFMQFSEKEKWLLAYLDECRQISFSALRRKGKLNYRLAENILVKLISWGLVKPVYSHNGIHYTINDKGSELL